MTPDRTVTPTGYSIAYTPAASGIHAQVWFPFGQGGGAAIGRDRAEAERMAAEIVRDHEGGRHANPR